MQPLQPRQIIGLEFPIQWKSPLIVNPHSYDVNQAVIQWLLDSKVLQLGDELHTTALNIQPGYFVGFPFPSISKDRLFDIGRLWTTELLWDDVEVEASPEDQARSTQEILQLFLLADEEPIEAPTIARNLTDLVRQILATMQEKHSLRFIKHHADGMHIWYRAARKEQGMALQYQANEISYSYEEFFDNRCITVGATAGMSLDYVYNYHIPREFHAVPAIIEMKRLAAAVCAIGNDVNSIKKDLAEDWVSTITLYMRLYDASLEEALEYVTSAHLDFCCRYDEIAAQILADKGFVEAFPFAADYIQQMRIYTSGVTLWECQAPRYTQNIYVHNGVSLHPEVSFIVLEAEAGD